MKNLYSVFNQRRGKAVQPYINYANSQLVEGEIPGELQFTSKKAKKKKLKICDRCPRKIRLGKHCVSCQHEIALERNRVIVYTNFPRRV